MGAEMSLQFVRAREALAAVQPITHKRPFPRVPPQMCLQMRRLIVDLPAAWHMTTVDIFLAQMYTRRAQSLNFPAVWALTRRPAGVAPRGPRVPRRRSGRSRRRGRRSIRPGPRSRHRSTSRHKSHPLMRPRQHVHVFIVQQMVLRQEMAVVLGIGQLRCAGRAKTPAGHALMPVDVVHPGGGVHIGVLEPGGVRSAARTGFGFDRDAGAVVRVGRAEPRTGIHIRVMLVVMVMAGRHPAVEIIDHRVLGRGGADSRG